jgi:hypothetical protein
MHDFLIPEKTILLGDKGTGKTAFYMALKNKVFFENLLLKAQKTHLNYSVINITNYENDSFEMLVFNDYLKDEFFIKKFWLFFIWNAICKRGDYTTVNSDLLVNLEDLSSQKKIIKILNSDSDFEKIEIELKLINNKFKKYDKRLIVTFDRLDNIVKPYLWDDIVSPLVKLCLKFPFENIHPKLFLRRDLYNRLGNLTNKNSFDFRIVKLEWSQNEMFAYFLKLIFVKCKSEFFCFLEKDISTEIINISEIKKKLKSKGIQHNQLPLETNFIRPIINLFFGPAKRRRNGKVSHAYDDLYRNIQSADKTINLRPFFDLIKSASIEQYNKEENDKLRKNSILGLAYCTRQSVRKEAVKKYLEDLWVEQGNEFVKYFCADFINGDVSINLRKNPLYEDQFDRLIMEVKNKHENDDPIIKKNSVEELKTILIANKIITTYMVGSKTRYSFAYLYTSYFGV